MKQYTFSEVAKIIGVTKNVIKSRAKKLPSDLLIRDNGVLYVDETGLNWFKKNLKNHPVNQKVSTAGSTQSDPVGSDPVPVQPVTADQSDLIKELRDRITSLEADKEQLNTRIDDLTTLLKQEQGINLHTSLLLKEREDQILKLEADTKKSWFSRVFHRSH